MPWLERSHCKTAGDVDEGHAGPKCDTKSNATSQTKLSKSSTLVLVRTNSSGRGEILELEKTVGASTASP
jgi:hypothetical protein